MRRGAQSLHDDRPEAMTELAQVWRALQSRFRALPDPERNLWAAESDSGTWVVWGGPTDRVARETLQKNFRTLAKEAAVSAHLTGRGSPVDAWLNHLKQGSFYRPGPTEIFAVEPSTREGGTDRRRLPRLGGVLPDARRDTSRRTSARRPDPQQLQDRIRPQPRSFEKGMRLVLQRIVESVWHRQARNPSSHPRRKSRQAADGQGVRRGIQPAASSDHHTRPPPALSERAAAAGRR